MVAARRLQRRRDRDQTGRFLAEGPQAVRSALAAGVVVELFGTADALSRHADLAAQAPEVSPVTDEALAALAETMHPQGLVAVCDQLDVPLSAALGHGSRPGRLDTPPSAAPGRGSRPGVPPSASPGRGSRPGAPGKRLVAVLADIKDPGNAGTVLRTADAAGAGAVVFAGEAVDPYNGKCVRASAGSLFHVDVIRERSASSAISGLRSAGLQVLAATGHGEDDLDDLLDAGTLAAPTAWLFGSEAHGLPEELLALADRRVRVPVYGGAESLNLAAAAAVCLYASARALRVSSDAS